MGKLATLSGDTSKDIQETLSGMFDAIKSINSLVQSSNEVASGQAATIEEITSTITSLTADASSLKELVHVDDVVKYYESPTVSTALNKK